MTVNANRGKLDRLDRNPVIRVALIAARMHVIDNLQTLNGYGAVDVTALDNLRAVVSLIDSALLAEAGRRTREER